MTSRDPEEPLQFLLKLIQLICIDRVIITSKTIANSVMVSIVIVVLFYFIEKVTFPLLLFQSS